MSSLSRPEIRTIGELARHAHASWFEPFAALIDIDRRDAVPLAMNARAWADTSRIMQAPREDVEHQELIIVRDRMLGSEAIFNPLRARRAARPSDGPSPAELIDIERDHEGCRWCDPEGWHVRQHGMWDDDFGAVRSADGRICARGNWARQAPISGVVFGDERMHNLLRLDRAAFVGLFDTAERYVQQARRSRPEAQFFLLYLNGGYKSAGSVAHAHVQVVGRAGRHFAYPERVAACCPPGYWAQLQDVHEALGLATYADETAAWVNVVPIKERDLTLCSPTVHAGATAMYDLLQALYRQGTNTFSLVAVLSPSYVTGQASAGRFASWPPVLWRFIDRGDMRVRHADVGGMELFGTTIVATDPFELAQWCSRLA